ncbi:MAG: hypothetical protein ACWGQW_03390 [bacterium]
MNRPPNEWIVIETEIPASGKPGEHPVYVTLYQDGTLVISENFEGVVINPDQLLKFHQVLKEALENVQENK